MDVLQLKQFTIGVIMNWFEKWMLNRIIAKQVIQGDHLFNITNLYRTIYIAATQEFNEDNKTTLDLFLTDCHLTSMGIDVPIYGFAKDVVSQVDNIVKLDSENKLSNFSDY